MVLVFFKFTAWPEMLAWPYLITKGILPYQDIAMAHTPLLVYDLAIFFKIFGVGIIQLKIYTWLLIILLDLLVFNIAKKLWGHKTAIFSLLFFIFWQTFFDGNGLWFDLGVGLVGLMSFYFLQRKNYLITGIFWSLAFLTKQTAIWFLVPIAIDFILNKKEKIKFAKEFFLSSLVVFGIFIGIFWYLGIIPKFFEWTIKFGALTLPGLKGQINLPSLRNLVLISFLFTPFVFGLLSLFQKGKKILKTNEILTLFFWSLAGIAGMYPRFEYFHLQPALPYIAFICGIIISKRKNLGKYLNMCFNVYIVFLVLLFANYFMRNYGEGTRFYEKSVLEVANEVKKNANPNDKLLVLNYWDSVYALTETIPASLPLIPNLEWYLSLPHVQEETVNDLKVSKPLLIVINPYTKDGLSSYKPTTIYNYVLENYNLSHKVSGIEFWKLK